MNYIDEITDDLRAELQKMRGRPTRSPQAMLRQYAQLVLTTGEHTTARNVHDGWATYTAGVNPDDREMIPFDDLPIDMQNRDDDYVRAIHRVARRRSNG